MSNLGDTLVGARRQAGFSAADIVKCTRIPGPMIEALERGDFDALPVPAYTRGYILAYAACLDIDPQPLLDMYVAESGAAARSPKVELPHEVVHGRQQVHALPLRTTLMIVGAIVLVVLVVWGIGKMNSEPNNPLPIPAETGATSSVEPSTEATLPGVVASDSDAPSSDAAATGESFLLTIEVDASAASWLRVTVDGLTAYEGTLAGGQSKEWEVRTEATVRVGKPEAVTILRDGASIEIPRDSETPTVTLRTAE